MGAENPTGPPWSAGLAGIVDCREIFRGRSRQASIGGVPQYVRIFLVRTEVVNPSLPLVAAAPGISWRDSHPDDANAILMESSAQQDGDSPFHYKVTYTYKYLNEAGNGPGGSGESAVLPWNRPPMFTFSGSVASAPAFWYYPNNGDNTTTQTIVNSAGDPLQGLDKDECEFTVTIQQNVKPPFFLTKAQAYVGQINAATWSGGPAKTWQVRSIAGKREIESIPNTLPNLPPVKVFYWDTTTTLAYKASGWDLRTWDVGFNEIKNGKRVKIYAGSDPVSEPAALDSTGKAKTPGQPPDLLTFRIYQTVDFSVFPEIPNTEFSGYPYA